MNTGVGTLWPNIVTTKLEANAAIEVANTCLSAATTMVVMDLYEAKVLMRFNAKGILNGLSAKADTLTDTKTSLSFESKEFVTANDF